MNENENEEIIVLIDEDGKEQEFELLATFEVEDIEYAALLPINGEEEEEEVYLLKMLYDENEDMVLMNIEDQDEFSDVAAAYEAIVDEII